MNVTSVFQPIIDFLGQLRIPLAIMGISFTILGFLIKPVVGRMGGEVPNYIPLACLGIAVFGFIPAFVTALASIGGSATPAPSSLAQGLPWLGVVWWQWVEHRAAWPHKER
jgi:hypothetical protein